MSDLINKNGLFARYVRKSRYDKDYGEASLEETLRRHEAILDALAKSLGITIAKTFKEVVSGDAIAERPEMQTLLSEVSNGMWDGILVIDIDRLSRGNSIDQGIVSQTFKYSDTKIITPQKIYDPNDDFDEEYFEFSLFMSRKEYKIINKRLERGRKQSSKEGKYMGSIAPYGYERVKIKGEKGYTLKIVEEEAQYVRMIFDLYLYEGLGYHNIRNRLNELGVQTRTGVEWSGAVVKAMLKNPVYAGLIKCSERKRIKSMVDGRVVERQTYLKDFPIYQGLHEPIVSVDEWKRVKEISAKNNRGNIPLNVDAPLQNYYAGIIFCAKCGKYLTRVTAGRTEPRIACRNTACDCVSATFSSVDRAIINAIKQWLWSYKKKPPKLAKGDSTDYDTIMKQFDAERSNVEKQLDKCYAYLEQEVYTLEDFKRRKAALTEKLDDIENRKAKLLNAEAEQQALRRKQMQLVPTVEELLGKWNDITNEEKNELLKKGFSRITYYRPPGDRNTDFEITITPNI